MIRPVITTALFFEGKFVTSIYQRRNNKRSASVGFKFTWFVAISISSYADLNGKFVGHVMRGNPFCTLYKEFKIENK